MEERAWVNRAFLILAALACLCGCERGEDAPSAVVLAERPMSAEMKAAVQMRAALDGGDVREALAGARRLMDSKDREVRSEVVTVAAWLGKKAMPELAALMRDQDESIAQEALTGWEQAFGELNYDFERSKRMLEAVSNLTDRATIDAVLMKTSELELASALPLLEQVILQCKGKPASTCAKEMFAHLAGEPWSSTNRTAKVISNQK